MALPFFQLQLPVAVSLPTTAAAAKTPPTFSISAPKFSKITLQPRCNRFNLIIPKSSKEGGEDSGTGTGTDEATPNAPAEEASLIKPPAKEEAGLLSGVAEEIGEIEWPGFGKVLGTTGVVLGVIAGSSVVLLTVNAVLAEISDKVFAGQGIQDFVG